MQNLLHAVRRLYSLLVGVDEYLWGKNHLTPNTLDHLLIQFLLPVSP